MQLLRRRDETIEHPEDVCRLRDALQKIGFDAHPEDIQWAFSEYSEEVFCASWLIIDSYKDLSHLAGEIAKRLIQSMSACGCHRCERERKLSEERQVGERRMVRMIVCENCGNKRCPHASDHRFKCTRSNDPGQAGSIY